MANPKMLIAVGRTRECVVGRTPTEFGMLVTALQDEPDVWTVYSTHMNMKAAHVRASQLRNAQYPQALLPYQENLEFKSMQTTEHGAVVAVRWRSTPS